MRICWSLSFLAGTVALLCYLITTSILVSDPNGDIARKAAGSQAIREQMSSEVQAGLITQPDTGFRPEELESLAKELTETRQFREALVSATRQFEQHLLTGRSKPVRLNAAKAMDQVAANHQGDGAVAALASRSFVVTISTKSVPSLASFRSVVQALWPIAALASVVLWLSAFYLSDRRRAILRESGKWLIGAAVLIAFLVLITPSFVANAIRPWGEIPAAAVRANTAAPLTVAGWCVGLGIPLMIFGRKKKVKART